MSSYNYVITVQRIESENKTTKLLFGCKFCTRKFLFHSRRQLLHHITSNHKDEITKEEYCKIRNVAGHIEKAHQMGVLKL